MTSKFHFKPSVPPKNGRPDHLAEALEQARLAAEAARESRRNNHVTMWRAALIGGFAMFAVFAGLEGMKPAPEKGNAPELQAMRDAPALEPAKKSPPAVAAKGKVESIAPSPIVEPTPLPEVAPVPPVDEKTTDTVQTEAQRIAAEPVMNVTGPDSQRETAITRDKKLLSRAIDGKAWDAYRELLGKSIKTGLTLIKQGQGTNRFDRVWNEPILYQVLLRWRTLGWFSESQISEHMSDAYTGGFITWLLNDNQAMEELLLTLSPKDDSGQVLNFLMEAWSANEKNRKQYFPLALACAVVFDKPLSIPHPIGSKEYEAESSVNPMKRYLWYIEKNEKGGLVVDVGRQNARDLIWVVCAPITTSEMEWALRRMPLRRNNWGKAYGMVEYLMERAVEGKNPYKEYSFEEILKEGGICGDQSYFCVNTARARGIPAMSLSGETDLGGHAWAGIKIDNDQWTTGIGRIGGVSKGQTGNPQTGDALTEQEILAWNDRHHQNPIATLSIWRHFWLGDFFAAMEDDENHAAAIRLANKLGQSFSETWAALYELLEKQMQLTGEPPAPNNLNEWKDFAGNMRREFKDNPRMAALAANAELEYIFPYGQEDVATRSLMRERRTLNRDAGEQTDLIADSLKRQADLIMKRGGPGAKHDVGILYDRALRDYGGSITGFKMMADTYFNYLKDDKELAHKAARDIELAFKRVVETGSTDWFRANTESSIYKMICEYYRAAGDPERADLLEKRYQILLRRAKRKAL